MNFDYYERLHAVIDAGRKLVDDQTASISPELYDSLEQSGNLIEVGTRINWNGALKRAAVDLWDTEENTPDNAPTLWEDINYRDGYRVLTGPISASNPVQPGEKCWEGDVLYECIYHVACTYRPSEYAAAWEAV